MKIQLGMLVTSVAGKAGGQYIRRFKNGFVLQNISLPTQRLLSNQNNQKRINSFMFSSWSRLDPDTIEEWREVALRLTRVNTFGVTVPLTGREAYTRLNSILYAYNESQIKPDLIDFTIPTLIIDSIKIDSITQSMRINVSSLFNADFFIYRGAKLTSYAQNPTISKQKTYSRTNTLYSNSYNYVNLNNYLGPIIQGTFFIISIQAVSASGITSLWQTFKVKVT